MMCFVECFIEEAPEWTAGPYTMSERDSVKIDLPTPYTRLSSWQIVPRKRMMWNTKTLKWAWVQCTAQVSTPEAVYLQAQDLTPVATSLWSLRSRFKTTLLDLCKWTNWPLSGSPPGLDWLLQWFQKCRCRRPAGSSPLPPLPWDTLQPAIRPIKYTWELRARTKKFICKILNRLKKTILVEKFDIFG